MENLTADRPASLLDRAAASLAADGVTPDAIRAWGAPHDDPDVRAYFEELAGAVAPKAS